MKRLSIVVEDLVSELDALSGEYLTKHHNSERLGRLKDVLKEIIWCNTEIFFDRCGEILEYIVAKPRYHLENALLGNSPNINWIYGKSQKQDLNYSKNT